VIISGPLNGWYGTFNLPAWSIGIELFCYLTIFPLLVVLNRRLKKRSLRFATALVIICASTYLLLTFYTHHDLYVFKHGQWDITFVGRGILGFTSGFFICSVYQMYRALIPPIILINCASILAILFLMATRSSILPESYIVCTFPIIAYLTAFDVGLLAGLLKTPFFQWLGERSYSIYLWQFPACSYYLFCLNVILLHSPAYSKFHGIWGLLHFIVAIGIVLLISELSYRYFEVPFRQKIRAKF
jgi:peptidoglycan/LPS O-acetylase OafA/YrhL